MACTDAVASRGECDHKDLISASSDDSFPVQSDGAPFGSVSSDGNFQFADLPLDVLPHIFLFIPFPDLIQAGPACTQWMICAEREIKVS
tara:strand:+ start:219 stop:485 length:267 start_codon:yes stop_codon:yes gene_type:complete